MNTATPPAPIAPLDLPPGDYTEIARQSATDFRMPGKKFQNPHLATSNNSDAYLITAWCLYHAGKLPKVLHKSRGYSWRVECPGLGSFVCTVKNANDHREGLTVL